MTVGKKSIGLAAAIALGAFVAGYWSRGRVETGVRPVSASGRKILYWHDPMHPAYRSDKPGIAPDCGMQLEPVYEGSAPAEPHTLGVPGTVTISAGRRQLIGVRTDTVGTTAQTEALRLLGKVSADETRIYRLYPAVDGFVREVSNEGVGNLVEKDQLLATFFSREILTTQQGYLFALSTRDREARNPAGTDQARTVESQVRAAEDALLALGMSAPQIREVARTRTATPIMQVRAPEAAVILARNIARGQRVDRSAEIFRLADIRQVYVLADVHEREAKLIPPGGRARVRYEGELFDAEIARALPLFDPATRTFKLRLEAANPRFVMRPDMFVEVEIPLRLPPGITVPADAVVDAGTRKIVYVDHGDDTFEPRAVETGRHLGDRVAIMHGLSAGERIVISGTFLVDSESRLSTAALDTRTHGGDKDPVCGMEVDPARALSLERGGKTYRFCSDTCRKKFEASPR